MRVPVAYTALAGITTGALAVALLPAKTLFKPKIPEAEQIAHSAGAERWACPMIDFIGNKPGLCPVCGMELQRVTAGELNEEQQWRAGVQLATAVEAPAVATVRAYGTVRYDDRTARVVIPRIGGRVVKRYGGALHSGVLVKQGDPLIDLYSPEVFASQAELAAAVKLGDQVVVRSLMERFSRWNLEAVARRIADGSAPVDTVTITSPFEGRVILDTGTQENSSGLPAVGAELAADQPIVRVVDPHSFMVIVQVPETRAHWLREGQPVRIASDDMGELPDVQAVVSWLSPELNLQLRTREAHLHLTDPQGRLLPGSLVNARIAAALDGELRAADPSKPESWGRFVVVPKSAVLSTGVRHVAWRVAEKQSDGRLRFELATLALGPRLEDAHGNDLWVVRAGLSSGDQVATGGAFLIDSQAQLAGSPSLLFPQGASATAAPHQH
jgi:membrane fusion protein, copper/silver efflux system